MSKVAEPAPQHWTQKLLYEALRVPAAYGPEPTTASRINGILQAVDLIAAIERSSMSEEIKAHRLGKAKADLDQWCAMSSLPMFPADFPFRR